MSSLLKKTIAFSTGTLLSRILGFGREIMFTYFLGASLVSDIFFATFRIPNFLRKLLAEGTLSFAYINIFSRLEKEEGSEEALKLSSAFLNFIFLITFLLFILVFLFSDQIIRVVLIGFEGNKLEIASYYLRWLFPFIILISLSSVFAGFLNIKGAFLIPAASSGFLNISLITGVLLFKSENIFSMGKVFGISVLLAGLLQFIMVMLFSFKKGFRYYFILNHPGLRRMLFFFIPGTFAMAITQMNVLVDGIFASYLPTGGISWLNYGNRLMQFPLGLFGIAISTVMTPEFAKDNDKERANLKLCKAFRMNSVLIIPCMIGLMIFSEELVSLIFFRGEFDYKDVLETSKTLFYYSSGLWFYAAVKIMMPMFYSQNRVKIPVFSALFSLIVNSILNFILIKYYQASGLALATAISALLNFMLLRFFSGNAGVRFEFIFKMTTITIILTTMLILLKQFNIFFIMITSVILYMILLKVFKLEEFDDLIRFFNKKRA